MRPLPLLLPLLLLVPGAQGWVAGPDRPHHADIAEIAAERLPPEWRDVLLAEREAFRNGALDPDGVRDPETNVNTFYHTWEPGEQRGGGVYRVQLSLHVATMALRDGNATEEVAYQMGFLTHFVADLSMPFHTGNDIYDDERHASFENFAYDRRAEYADALSLREPREVQDVEAYMQDVAQRSAALAPRLLLALDASAGAWSPETRDVAAEAHALAVEATADLLYTAFARGDASRPAPTFEEDVPLPEEPEDVGLSLTEIRKRYPWALPLASLIVLVGATLLLVIARRRRSA